MRANRFGGDWTEDKLQRLGKYLKQYRLIFSKNPKAQFFTTVYVDAFASTGDRVDTSSGLQQEALPPELFEAEAQEFHKGSVRIALELDSPFHNYLFIELSANRAT